MRPEGLIYADNADYVANASQVDDLDKGGNSENAHKIDEDSNSDYFISADKIDHDSNSDSSNIADKIDENAYKDTKANNASDTSLTENTNQPHLIAPTRPMTQTRLL